MSPRWGSVSMRFLGAVFSAVCLFPSAYGAAFFVETFDGASGWYAAGVGMVVAETGLFGNPAGSLQGSFAAQGTPAPETGAFRADGSSSGSAFTGDYFSDVPTFTSWVFDFYADDVLPSDLLVRFSDGTSTFFRSVLPQVGSIDVWAHVTVPLSYGGWLGGSAAAFDNALANVTFIDVQITRNGAGVQSYFLDNFELTGSTPPVDSSVPEPSQGLLILGSLLLFAVRRSRSAPLRRRRALLS